MLFAAGTATSRPGKQAKVEQSVRLFRYPGENPLPELTMTSRERVVRAINRQPTDVIPVAPFMFVS